MASGVVSIKGRVQPGSPADRVTVGTRNGSGEG